MRACFACALARTFSALAAFFSAASRVRNSTIHAGVVLGASSGEYISINMFCHNYATLATGPGSRQASKELLNRFYGDLHFVGASASGLVALMRSGSVRQPEATSVPAIRQTALVAARRPPTPDK
jgi:hypothetical protein